MALTRLGWDAGQERNNSIYIYLYIYIRIYEARSSESNTDAPIRNIDAFHSLSPRWKWRGPRRFESNESKILFSVRRRCMSWNSFTRVIEPNFAFRLGSIEFIFASVRRDNGCSISIRKWIIFTTRWICVRVRYARRKDILVSRLSIRVCDRKIVRKSWWSVSRLISCLLK